LGIFWINPGYAAFLQLALGNAVRMPFSLTRWALLQLLHDRLMMPSDPVEAARWEYDQWLWLLPSLASLIACGTVLRIAALLIFTMRETLSVNLTRLQRRLTQLRRHVQLWARRRGRGAGDCPVLNDETPVPELSEPSRGATSMRGDERARIAPTSRWPPQPMLDKAKGRAAPFHVPADVECGAHGHSRPQHLKLSREDTAAASASASDLSEHEDECHANERSPLRDAPAQRERSAHGRKLQLHRTAPPLPLHSPHSPACI
jgi:hypothetical protein